MQSIKRRIMTNRNERMRESERKYSCVFEWKGKQEARKKKREIETARN